MPALVVVLHHRDCIPLTFNELRKIMSRIPVLDSDHAALGTYAVRYAVDPIYRVAPSNSDYLQLLKKIEGRLNLFKA